jgi:hypothetical protein
MITKNIGIVGKAALDINGVNDSLLDREVNGAGNPFFYIYHFNGNFKIWQCMAGAFLKFKLYRGAYVWMQFMGGYIFANYPSFTIIDETHTTAPLTYSFQNSTSLGYSGSLSFEDMLCRNIGFAGALSYTATTFNYPAYTLTAGGTSSIQNTSVTMSYGSIQVTAGLNFHL